MAKTPILALIVVVLLVLFFAWKAGFLGQTAFPGTPAPENTFRLSDKPGSLIITGDATALTSDLSTSLRISDSTANLAGVSQISFHLYVSHLTGPVGVVHPVDITMTGTVYSPGTGANYPLIEARASNPACYDYTATSVSIGIGAAVQCNEIRAGLSDQQLIELFIVIQINGAGLYGNGTPPIGDTETITFSLAGADPFVVSFVVGS